MILRLWIFQGEISAVILKVDRRQTFKTFEKELKKIKKQNSLRSD